MTVADDQAPARPARTLANPRRLRAASPGGHSQREPHVPSPDPAVTADDQAADQRCSAETAVGVVHAGQQPTGEGSGRRR